MLGFALLEHAISFNVKNIVLLKQPWTWESESYKLTSMELPTILYEIIKRRLCHGIQWITNFHLPLLSIILKSVGCLTVVPIIIYRLKCLYKLPYRKTHLNKEITRNWVRLGRLNFSSPVLFWPQRPGNRHCHRFTLSQLEMVFFDLRLSLFREDLGSTVQKPNWDRISMLRELRFAHLYFIPRSSVNLRGAKKWPMQKNQSGVIQ